MPPRVQPEGGRVIRIEDIDRGVKQWFDRMVDAHIVNQQGERQKVTVLFSAGERWVMAADRQGIRDRDGRLILPVIQIAQKTFDTSQGDLAIGINVPTLTYSKRVSPKTSQLAAADTRRPLSDRRLRSGAVYDVWTIPFPANGVFVYNVTIQAQYRWQINQIVEKIVNTFEFFNVDSFVIEIDGPDRPEGIREGVGQSEVGPADHQPFDHRPPLDRPYVVGYIEGAIDDEGNYDEFTDKEPIVQLRFSFKVPAALQLDPEGDRPAVQKQRTSFTVSMGEEDVVAVDDPYDLELIFGPDGVRES